MKHIEEHHPDSEIDTDAMYKRLFHLAIVGHISTRMLQKSTINYRL